MHQTTSPNNNNNNNNNNNLQPIFIQYTKHYQTANGMIKLSTA
jgi:hypothetical protein